MGDDLGKEKAGNAIRVATFLQAKDVRSGFFFFFFKVAYPLARHSLNACSKLGIMLMQLRTIKMSNKIR